MVEINVLTGKQQQIDRVDKLFDCGEWLVELKVNTW